jgi:hypothetical protein
VARDAALEEGNFELARKLLELEIEERKKPQHGTVESTGT